MPGKDTKFNLRFLTVFLILCGLDGQSQQEGVVFQGLNEGQKNYDCKVRLYVEQTITWLCNVIVIYFKNV